MLVGTDKNLELNSSVDDIDDLLIGPVNPSQIGHRLRSLVRLNTMHEELVGHHAPVKVMLTTTLAGFQHGDTAESLIERTRNVDLRVAA